ncbi:MAG: hypothetical protein II118_00315 [Ruminococcus sp.]|nr:hypothetical protein [Ruminococcus sp.]
MIIDTHTHIGVLPPFYMTADMLLGSMERYGIDFSKKVSAGIWTRAEESTR